MKLKFIRALSIIVSSYTNPNAAKREAMKEFLILFFKIYSIIYPKKFKRSQVPKSVLSSRYELTRWLVKTQKLKLWYNAPDVNHSPRLWGPHLWFFLHESAKWFNPDTKILYQKFMYRLSYLLPCHRCAKHFKELYKELKMADTLKEISNKQDYMTFMNFIHTEVNKKRL